MLLFALFLSIIFLKNKLITILFINDYSSFTIPYKIPKPSKLLSQQKAGHKLSTSFFPSSWVLLGGLTLFIFFPLLCSFRRKSTSSLSYPYLWAVLSIVMVSRPQFLEPDNGSKTYLTEVVKSKEVMHENNGMLTEDIIILTINLIYVIVNSNECRLPLSQSSDTSVYPCNT